MTILPEVELIMLKAKRRENDHLCAHGNTAERVMHGTIAAGLIMLIANRAVSSETAAVLREPRFAAEPRASGRDDSPGSSGEHEDILLASSLFRFAHLSFTKKQQDNIARRIKTVRRQLLKNEFPRSLCVERKPCSIVNKLDANHAISRGH